MLKDCLTPHIFTNISALVDLYIIVRILHCGGEGVTSNGSSEAAGHRPRPALCLDTVELYQN